MVDTASKHYSSIDTAVGVVKEYHAYRTKFGNKDSFIMSAKIGAYLSQRSLRDCGAGNAL
jgi:hypothetical protein